MPNPLFAQRNLDDSVAMGGSGAAPGQWGYQPMPGQAAPGQWGYGQPMPGQAGGAGQPITDLVGAQRNRISGLTEGRGDATMQDAITNQALSRLGNISSGQDAPFTQGVQDQMLARRADMSAAAAAQQGGALDQTAAANGGSAADPSLRAARQGIESNRQQQNEASLGDIQTQAQLSNFDARNTGTMELAGTRANQLGMANGQYNRGADFLSREGQAGPHVNGVTPAQPSRYNFDFSGFGRSGVGAGVNDMQSAGAHSYIPPGADPNATPSPNASPQYNFSDPGANWGMPGSAGQLTPSDPMGMYPPLGASAGTMDTQYNFGDPSANWGMPGSVASNPSSMPGIYPNGILPPGVPRDPFINAQNPIDLTQGAPTNPWIFASPSGG